MHKDPMPCIIFCKTFSSKKLFLRHSIVHLPPTLTCEMCDMAFNRGYSLRRHQVACYSVALLLSSVQPLW